MEYRYRLFEGVSSAAVLELISELVKLMGISVLISTIIESPGLANVSP